jgi:hypothetical protein
MVGLGSQRVKQLIPNDDDDDTGIKLANSYSSK